MHYRVLTAFFVTRAEADSALAELLKRGLPRAAIRILPNDVAHLDDLGVKVTSKASEGAALGAALGGTLGAILIPFTEVKPTTVVLAPVPLFRF